MKKLFPLLVAVLLPVSVCLAEASEQSSRYNVILLIADDLNDSIAGFHGHDQTLTPHLDQLGRQGVRFLNAHANAPICAPSRASFLTGLHPRTSGLYGHRQQANRWRNNPTLKNAVTFMEHFRANGYDVYGTGKVFHNGHEDMSVWKNDAGGSNFGEQASFGPYPWDGAYRAPHGAIGWQPHPGLPKPLQKVWGQGFGPLANVPEYPPNPETGAPGYRGWVLGDGPFRYVDDSDRDLMPDELNTKFVVGLLQQTHERPFLIACGFNRPHTPLYAPTEYFERFPIETIELPPWLENDLEDVPAIFSTDVKPGSDRNVGPSKYRDLMAAGGVKMWKRWVQAYLACVAFVDDQVGAILQQLEASEFADDTLVIFTGDHGYHMGEKNYLFKNSLWEESTRVPLIVRIPGQGNSGTEVLDPVSLVDLYPSLIEWCGLPGDPNKPSNGLPLDGRSLAAYTTTGALPPAMGDYEGVLTAIAGDDPLEIDKPGKPERQHWSWRTKRYRYTLANNGEEELYDHDNDPNEWTNLANDSEYAERKQKLREALSAALE